MSTYQVGFVGDYFAMSTSVDYESDYDYDAIIECANDQLKEHYGWDVGKVSTVDIWIEEL